MGLITSASTSSASSAATSLLSPVGVGIGSVFVVVALVALLAYLDIFDSQSNPDPEIRRTLVSTAIPLLFAFCGVVLYNSLQVV